MTRAWLPTEMFPGGADASAGLALWNAFAGGAGAPIALGGASVVYELAQAPASVAPVVALEAPGWPAPVLVVPLAFPFRELANVEIEVGDLPMLPPDLRHALRTGMLTYLRRLLGTAGAMLDGAEVAGEGSLAQIARPGEPVREWLRLRLEVEGGAALEALAGVPRTLLLDLAATGALASAPGALAAGLAVDVDLSLGSVALTLRELAGLEPGDVVVLADDPAERFTLRVGTLAFHLTPAPGGWVSAGARRPERSRPNLSQAFARTLMTIHNEAADSAESAAQTLDLAELPLSVDFDLARVQLPYASVATWRPGAVIELTTPSSENGVAVTIRVNGEAVGTGDIVRIDERIGVRITRLNGPGR